MKPLLCNSSVVRAFLNSTVGSWPAKAIDSSKPMQYQDRRLINGLNYDHPFSYRPYTHPATLFNGGSKYDSPIKVGDVLYVRENVWDYDKAITSKMLREGADTWPVCMFSADMTKADVDWCKEMGWKQRPSIHMPKELSRINLEVMRVRVERACDISEEDAIAEGAEV